MEENIPVLVAVQEGAAPKPFKSVYDSDRSLAVSLLLAPTGMCSSPMCRLRIGVSQEDVPEEKPVSLADVDLRGNFVVELFDLLLAVAEGTNRTVNLPVSTAANLSIDVTLPGSARNGHG
jgi:hypothetical protein